jgi:hypothetical protein
MMARSNMMERSNGRQESRGGDMMEEAGMMPGQRLSQADTTMIAALARG